MPELPEVEHCARRLRSWLEGRAFAAVRADRGKPLRDITPADLHVGLRGRRVTGIRRVGKQLLLDLDDQQTLLVHLGMTGKFIRAEDPERPATRVRFDLDDGTALHFLDFRRFGRVRLLAPGASHPEVDKLGTDALELCRTPGALREALARTSRPIKVALMDQTLLAGVGNIYAAEALYVARVDPRAPANGLSPTTYEELSAALVEAMEQSLARERDDEITYLQEVAAKNPFLVYDREGERCPRSGGPIRRFEQAGRSTFWVPRWQTRGRKSVRAPSSARS